MAGRRGRCSFRFDDDEASTIVAARARPFSRNPKACLLPSGSLFIVAYTYMYHPAYDECSTIRSRNSERKETEMCQTGSAGESRKALVRKPNVAWMIHVVNISSMRRTSKRNLIHVFEFCRYHHDHE